MKRNSNISCEDENFTLCGWDTEENQLKDQVVFEQKNEKSYKLANIMEENPKVKRKTDANYADKTERVLSTKNARILTSQNCRKNKRSQSHRVCPQNKSLA